MTEQPRTTAPECAECGSAMAVVPLLIGTGMQCTRCTPLVSAAAGGKPLTDQATAAHPGFICLYTGPSGMCWNCGGWTRAEGGPFPGDPRYCSEDCFADAQARSAAARGQAACCPECGYDRQEHRPRCGLIPGGYCPGGGGPVCSCGASWPPASLDAEGSPAHRPLAHGGPRG